MLTTAVTPTRPRPKTSVISGVSATRGTERSVIAAGMIVRSIPGDSTTRIAAPVAASVPTT